MAKRKRKAEHADLGTPELSTHHEVMLDTGIKRARVVDQRPMDRYKSRKLVTETQWQASERFREDFDMAIGQPQITASYASDRIPSGRTAESSEAYCRALQRYRKAMSALGEGLGPMMLDVVCLDHEAASWMLDKGFNARSGLDFLRNGLDVLRKNYGIS